MRQNHTQLVVVLDRSGSMQSIKESTIAAYNQFIKKQKEITGTADIMLAQFDNVYEVVYNGNLENAPELNASTFVPRGSTALNDAMGRSFDEIGRTLAALPEDQRASKVIVAVFTDGGENASKDYTTEVVANIVKEQTDKYAWDISFFGANQDAVLTGKKYNINFNNSFTFNADPNSVHNTMAYYSKGTEYIRSNKTRPAAFIGIMRSMAVNSAVKANVTEIDKAWNVDEAELESDK
jgi:hypothetical protein